MTVRRKIIFIKRVYDNHFFTTHFDYGVSVRVTIKFSLEGNILELKNYTERLSVLKTQFETGRIIFLFRPFSLHFSCLFCIGNNRSLVVNIILNLVFALKNLVSYHNSCSIGLFRVHKYHVFLTTRDKRRSIKRVSYIAYSGT